MSTDGGPRRLGPARHRRQPEPLIPDGPIRASADICQAAGCLSMGSDQLLEVLRDAVLARAWTMWPSSEWAASGCAPPALSWRSRSRGGSSSGSTLASKSVTDELVDSLAGEAIGGRSVATDPFFPAR